MHLITKERFKLEIKSIVVHRQTAKYKSKRFEREAGILYREVESAGTGYHDKRYSSASSKSFAAAHLRYDKSYYARHLFISYALLRGVPYNAIEKTCLAPPSDKLILEIINKLALRCDSHEWTLEKIQELLK